MTQKTTTIKTTAPAQANGVQTAELADKPLVLCVGHEPHISTTISAMISGKTAASVEVKKASACAIRFSGIPKSGAGTLLWLLPPKLLRLLGDR